MNKDIEKIFLPDSDESFDQKKKIDQWLHHLEKKSDEYFARMEDTLDSMEQPFEQQDALYESSDELKNLHVSIDIQSLDNNREKLQPLQDGKRLVSDKKLSTPVQISPQVQDTLMQASETPESVFGRQESYAQVQNFANSVANEKGLFGRLVKMLS